MIVTVTLNPGVDRTLTVEELRFNEVLRARKVHWIGVARLECGAHLEILVRKALQQV
jgi:hypothetical protein